MFEGAYIFYGKNAERVLRLAGKLDNVIDKEIFKTNYDVYLLAPLIGWIYKRKGELIKTGKNTKVFGEKVVKERKELIFNFRTMMLLINADKGEEEAKRIAFRFDENNEEMKEYITEYEEYVLGGVDEMYERIFEKNNAKTTDEYIMNLYEFIEDIRVRLYGEEIREE